MDSRESRMAMSVRPSVCSFVRLLPTRSCRALADWCELASTGGDTQTPGVPDVSSP